MSIFHCQAKAISRASGRSATAAAAYRAGERIIDERTGEVHDYRRKKGVLHSQIYVPQGVRMMSRSALWNLAEKAEKRKDAKVAREWELALPAELSRINRMYLAHHFARAIVERYGVAVDMCIHAPGKKGDDRNHHVHVLTTTRVLRRDGFGEKTRVLDSPRTSGEEVTAVRKIWEQLCNRALELDMLPERVDSRSLKAQGINREPTRHLGPIATAIERRGRRSFRGDEHRRGHESRTARELAVLQKIEGGIEAAKQRHAQRKRQAELEAKRVQREKEAERVAAIQQRNTKRKGMQR